MVPRSAASPSNAESRERVLAWLIDWFFARGKVHTRSAEIADIDYFEAGWMTSMEVVEFVTAIEDRFSIQFSDQDMQDARFMTISGLAELITQNAEVADNLH